MIMRDGYSSNSDNDWQIALRNQIEEIARRNSDHKKYAQVEDRTQEMDDIVVRLRELLNTNPTEAARLHVQAISILDETDRLIAATMPDASRITPYVRQSGMPIGNVRRNRHNTNKIMPEKTTTTMRFTTFADDEGTDDEVADKQPTVVVSDIRELRSGYGAWRLLCLCHGTEAKNKGDNDVRDLWKTQFEFFLSLVGFMVGVGNTLKFPSLAYQHGGGVFLIPYFVCLALFGLPIVFMHLCIGQYSGLSASGAFWKLMPIASGIGWALVLLALPVSIYYNVIVAWSIHYFWFSFKGFFTGGLPWSHCHPDWPKNIHCCLLNDPPECFLQPHAISAPEAYFHYEVLNRTAKIYPENQFTAANLTVELLNATLRSNIIIPAMSSENVLDPALGPIQSHLVLSLAFAWILVFLGVFKGIGSIGWAVSITSTLPFLLLGMLLLRGMSLPGADQGLAFLFKPDIEKIWSIPMWKAAAEQVFYSLGIDAGPLISMASFSRYRNNIYRDAVAVVLINTFTSILAGMVIFSYIGFIAQSQHRPIDDILQRDPLYIAFTVYPGVTTFMDMMGPLWAALFFAMLTLSAVDAQFAWIEMIVSSIMNQFNKVDARTETRLVVGLCIMCFICGLPLTTRGGIFIFHSIENLNANWNSFSLSFLQIIVICYVYGVNNFVTDVGEMLRVSTSLKEVLKSQNLSVKQVTLWRRVKFFFGPTGGYIRWTWSFCSPCILLFLLVASVFSYERVTLEDYPLPFHYELIAWFTMIGPLFVVPCAAICTVYDAWRNRMPLASVFDCSRWRHKNVGGRGDVSEPKHTENDDHDYWSIADPISRVASARRPNASLMDDVGYGTVVEMINEWAKKNATILGDRYIADDNVENQNNDSKQPGKKLSSSKVLSRQNSTQLTLFGAPPTVELLEKTNTVIYRPSKGAATADVLNNPRAIVVAESSLESTERDSWSSITRHVRRQSWGGSTKKSAEQSSRLFRRRSSADDQRTSHENVSGTAPGSINCSRDASPQSPFMHRILRSRHSTDRQSLGSISITPIDRARNHSTSTVSNLDVSSIASSRRQLPALRRPEPVNAPPPFTQL